jgi:hypothetical protein
MLRNIEQEAFLSWNINSSRQTKKWENEKVTEDCKISFP